MKHRCLALMVVVACACGASLAGPFYVGGSYGDASIEIDTSGFEFDDSDSGWKLYAGYRFLKFFGVEGSYVDLGAPSEGSVEVETTGWDAFGVGVLPLGPIELFAKAGAVSWETDVSGAGSDDGTDAAYGIGVGFSLKKIAFRLELEQFDVEDTDTVQMASVGVEWRF